MSVSVFRVYFNSQFFGTVKLSTDFLVELKLSINKTKISIVKHLQFIFQMTNIADYLKAWVTKNLENPNVDGFEIYTRKTVYILNIVTNYKFHKLTGLTR